MFLFIGISVYVLFRFTPKSLWYYNGVTMYVTYGAMHKFYSMHDGPIRYFGWQFQQNQPFHVMIGFKHNVTMQCEITGFQVLIGASVH